MCPRQQQHGRVHSSAHTRTAAAAAAAAQQQQQQQQQQPTWCVLVLLLLVVLVRWVRCEPYGCSRCGDGARTHATSLRCSLLCLLLRQLPRRRLFPGRGLQAPRGCALSAHCVVAVAASSTAAAAVAVAHRCHQLVCCWQLRVCGNRRMEHGEEEEFYTLLSQPTQDRRHRCQQPRTTGLGRCHARQRNRHEQQRRLIDKY